MLASITARSSLAKPLSSLLIKSIQDNQILVSHDGHARILSLNRPEKLNSLSSSMCKEISERLVEYSKSNLNNLIILNSTSPKAFCAGGDVVTAVENINAKNPKAACEFFHQEYSLNYLLSIYSKPVITLMNGITMGGGVGLSVHTPFRIASEDTRLAMPEMDIGFIPDVGTSFFLPKLDGSLGYYLALTGDDLIGIDNLIAGTATHYVPKVRIPELTKRLTSLTYPNDLLQDIGNQPNISNLSPQTKEFFSITNQAIEEFSDSVPENHKFKLSNQERHLVDKVFDSNSIYSAFETLESLIIKAEGSEYADSKPFLLDLKKKLNKKSPLSLSLAYELLNRGSESNNYDSLREELVAAQNIILKSKSTDFVTGVTEKLIKKTNSPLWKHKSYNDVQVKDVTALLSTEKLPFTELKNYINEDNANVKFSSYPANFALPSENEVKDYITGNDGTGRDYAVTLKEVFNRFALKYNDKAGMKWKIKNILERKTRPNKFDNQYLEWSY
ncbi:mitochondrial 37S ribosomal protein mS47 [Ascoidea rubescens DSM 1968]|uniref:3-hydroxyisobutyryl-CoA hydrolase n=1 Tax=Ascoidea rubescens DSM 1968 TaxID=1344418 RepID=A0A1D2VQP4_9ASCO|nr:3-hydroxyisobutyryl-CoA hydrolase [Ascoidea rubescens DSM 1968]ODV63919.1 3-hydroxyisobutyryl-CoA hydrolase [Ascoidea rubescens DSM 1968]